MADFGGFEIEDDEKKPSSPSAFGGFEIEDGDEGESGETGPVSPAEASSPKSPAPTSESQSLAGFMGGLANGSASAPAIDVSAWESGDGGEPTLPVGEKNQWGGNLRTEGRKPLIRRDAKGKVNGYSTTTSMFVKHNDGRIAVVPTVVDGVELSTEDAAQHYADTGEYWGMADDEEGAKKIARAVHDEHQKAYQKGWNEYIQSHWDDMVDEIRRDPGVRGERARRRRDARIAKEMEAWGDNAEVISGYRERTKTTQVAPELFLTGDLLEDADGNAVKPGDAIAVYHKEGDGPFTGEAGQSARLMEYTGVNADGKPVFKETEGVSSEGAMVAGKLHVRDDDFASMLGKGEGKIELSPGERVRLNLLAETGNYHRYDDTLFGAATAIADRIVPYGGRIGVNQSREQLRHLSNIYENILDEYPGKTDDEKRSVAAMDAGLDPIRKGESRDEYYARIRREAEEELRKRVIAKKEAGGKLSETEQGVLDKILTGGIESGGYALEFAIPGGAIFKGAKALGWGAKTVRAATMLGSAVPVVAAESMSRYQENVTPEYGFDDNGEFRMVAAPDDEEETAYKAIGGAIFDTAVEVGLEAATMGLLRGAGKATGWALGKATPSAVREFGAKRFSKFMASETGQALRSINRAYQDFTAMTQINSPLGELAEENVQAFEKVLGLDGKSSEYKGLAKEWQDFKDNQLSWQTQWDIFYGLIAQLAIGSAKSTAEGVSQHISSTDARRDIRMALKRSGISDETISTLTPKQQKTLTDMWQRYSANPDALKDRVKNLGYSMRAAVDELTARDGLKMRQSLEQRGIEPEKFVIQAKEDGKPAFQQMMRFTPDGKQAPMNAMTDAAHGVTIVDQGDGTFYVMNDFRGLDAIPAYSFEEAQKKADEEVVRNQSMDADNAQKAQYLMGLVQRQYAGRNVVSIPSEAALRWQVAQAVHDGGSIYGITRADQLFNADGRLKQPGAGGFHTPDGHIVVILDNVPSPAEMERVLAHEATGHEGVESATGRGANTVEFIQNAQAEGFSKFVLAEQRRAIQKFVAAGMDEATARMQVAAAMSTDEYAREAMARYAQGRLHQPTWYEKRKHELNQRRRKAGENVPIDQSDLEVMLAETEKQGAQGANELETLPGDSGVRYEEGATDEARNGADEAQPQQADEDAGRDGQQPAPQAAEGPVEVSPPRAEAPDAGVVEPSKTDNGGQNLNVEAKKPKGKRGDNLRGRSYEDYAASPDDGGTADEMGAALLRFVSDNGGLLKMPPNGVADPMADWINAFLDGNARKNNRGEFVALFGMKPKTGANDAIAENMPSGLKEFVEGMIERDGPGAVADWFLETRRKYREWAQNRRNAAQEATTDAVERYDFDELAAAQDAMDDEFANALGVVEGADEADYAMLTPENLKIAKSGDTIRFDHDRKSFVFGSYDAENGVLVVYDEDVAGMEGGKFRRAYRITENSIEEIEDGQGNENRSDEDRAGNEEGSQGGDFQLESVTAEQITAEKKKRAEKEAIKKRQEAPLKGSGAVNVQPEMDLGQTGQQDLFSPIAESGAQFVRPGSSQDKELHDSFQEGRRFVSSASGMLTEQRMIDPAIVLNGEDKGSDLVRRNLLENKTWDEVVNMPSTQKYIQMYKDGTLAPPADVIMMDNGRMKSLNRRRVVAAIEAGVKRIPANVETGERIEQHELERLRNDPSTKEVPLSAFKKAKPAPSDNRMARAKAAADRHVVVYGNGQKGTLADLIKNGGARLYPEKGLTVFDKGKPHVVTIGFQQFTPTKDELPYLIQLQKDYDAAHPDDVPPSQRKEPAKTAHASAPRADGTTTPPKSADAPQGEKSAENATPATQTPVQKKYAELLAKLDDAGKKLDAAVKAVGASDGAIADQIARSEALIEQYRAELAVRRFEREHKEERLGQDWKDIKDRPFTSLSDNEIRKRMADSATVIEQLKEELPSSAPVVLGSRTTEKSSQVATPPKVGAQYTKESQAGVDFPVGTIVERSDGRSYERIDGDLEELGRKEPKWRDLSSGARPAFQSHVFSMGGGTVVSVGGRTEASPAAKSLVWDSVTPEHGRFMSGAITDPSHIKAIHELDREHDILEVVAPPSVNNFGTMYVDVIERKGGRIVASRYYVDSSYKGDAYHPVVRGLQGGELSETKLQDWHFDILRGRRDEWLRNEAQDATATAKPAASKSSAPATPRTPSIKMKNEAAEKLARQQEDDLAALFDTPELGVNFDTKELKSRLEDALNVDPAKGRVLPRATVVEFSDTPQALLSVGMPMAKIISRADTIRKISREHHLSSDDMARLPQEYAKPVLVFKDGDNFVVVTGMQGATDAGVLKPVEVFLRPAGESEGRNNYIASAYAREPNKEQEYLRLAHIPGALLMADKTRAADIGLEEATYSQLRPLIDSGSVADSVPQSGGESKGDAIALNFDTPELAGVNVRTKAPPKKTGIGYKVFVRGKDGGLYPPMVANPNGAATPVGVWIDASEGVRAETSKTGRNKVKAGGKGTNGGSGSLAWRPGWHLGEIPYALQFNVGPKVPNPLGIKNAKGEVIKIGEFFPGNFVWAEVEYAADVDYQDEAMSYGRTPSGKFNHALAGLPRLPVDGSYKYRTNANPATDPWIITGSMKVNRVLTDAEVDAIVRRAGREPQKRESEVVQKFLAWAKKWKLDPSKQKVRDEWASRNGVSFDTKTFDPDMFQKRVGAVAKLVKTYKDSGVADFKTLATRMAERFPDKFGAMKPYLRGVWNAVAEQMDLEEVSRKDAEATFAAIERPQETAPAPETLKPPPANKLMSTRISDAADEIVALIERGQKFSRKDVTDIVERQLGGKVSNGDFDAKQVTDILELAVNRFVAKGKSLYSPAANASADAAVRVIQRIRENILALIPTQTTRSIEQDKMQQFSTPPHEAFAAAWVANMNDGDVMLEPSAGIGGLAVFGASAGAKVITNELSPLRSEILEQLGLGKPFEFNAENLYAFLEPDIKAGKLKRPTVVVMNPPFSNSQRTDKKNTHIGADHVEQALKLLAPGGRLVAIVGNGMAHGKPAFKAWWDRIGREYTVRANVGINGQEYAKYGTTFDNNLIVIDKVAPNGSIAPIYGTIESLDELPALLEGVRNDRPTAKVDQSVQPAPREQGGSGGVAPNGRNAGPVATPRPSAGASQGGVGGQNAAGRRDGRPVRPQAGNVAGLGAQDNGPDDGRGDGRGQPGEGGRANTPGLDVGRASAGPVQPEGAAGSTEGLAVQSVEQTREVGDGTFSEYKPSKISIPGMKPHPTALVESSAMASVQPPNPTYSPKIPKKIIEDGVLSEAQIEQVVYAGQAHEQMLGNGERKGYFIGDGTGVGKGREISGVILDNFNNGRRRAVWVSKTSGLSNDAKRDLTPFGLAEELFTLEAKNLKNLGARGHGVAFTTYSSLAKDHERIDEHGNVISSRQGKESRMQALVKWLGRDFDGVIVFDESHLAGNAVPMRGKRGMTKPSAQALAVVDLQKALPRARILYVSATGATEVNNLAYATRLGLWGRGTAFKDRDAFITQVSNGGISVMEIVARDMKAMGVYMARTLSYEGIENERVTHELSPDQVKQYNLLAETWQMVMGEVESALISSNGIHGKANGNVKSAFWGAHQRFFNQTLTAMQMPTVLSKARELWEAGYSPVFQIVTTNEAAQNRAIQNSKDAGGEVDVENLDLSPRDILIGFVEQSFPTVQYVEEETDGGDTKWVPLTDANGNPVHDPAAVERKERLLGRLQRMKMGEAPLDMILNEFGHENVAEVTGRSARREMVRNSDGEMEMKIVRRTKNNAKQEADEFNDGKRTVLVFSGAGNTGFSFHADRKFGNQRRRVQFMIEAGYNAAAAIQGLGRTHRANESSHPLYMLCSTNLPGHKRFMSTIARRLAQLGSLTSGDRSSSGSGVFSESDNLENQYAKNAVLSIFEEMFMEDPAKFNRICTEMGFMKARVNSKTGEREYVNTLINEEGEFDAADKLDIPHFLNRILAMKIDAQNELFDEFSERMADDIERAKENGTFDPGMEKLKGITVEVKNRTRLWEDAQKIGSTDIVEVGVTKKSRKTDYATAKERMSLATADGAVPRVYTHNGSGEVLMMVETKQTKTMKDGSIVSLFRQLRPNGETGYTTETAVEKNYTQVTSDEEGAWTRAYEATPDLIEQSRFFANGTLLPIWDRLGATNPRFFKVAPTGGAETQTFLGMEIAPENVENVLARFGKSVGAVEVTPDVQLRRVMKDGKRVELQNGWTLKRVKVLGDNRIEIDGVDEDADVLRLAQEPFAYTEKIGYLRVFLKPNAESMAQFLAEYPAVPDKGSLATASGAAQDLGGDKYKAPLKTFWSRIERATPADATALGDELRNFIVRLSSEQLGEVFDDYMALDDGELSAAHVIRKLALNELEARGALDWKRRQQAESESRGGDIVNFDTHALGAPYQGSKSRIAMRIVAALPQGTRFVDLFSGGGSMTHAAMLSGKYGTYRMNDLDGTGQDLFLEGVRGKWDGYSRKSMTPEEFAKIKGTPEALAWSFNGLGRNLAIAEEGGRDRAAEQIRRVQSLSSLKDKAGKVVASKTDYRKVKLHKGDVVYADIPYDNTDARGYRKGMWFDKAAFVEWAQRQDVPVYVSEYEMPDGWTELRSFAAPGMRGGEMTERLFVQDKFAERVLNAPGVNFDTPEISPVDDAAYMDAVNRGDMETAQTMVREAAKRAGYNNVAYHGTPFGGWNQYDFSRGGMESGNGRGVISLTSDRSEAEAYSKSDSAADVSDIMFRVNNVLARIPDEAWSATTDIGMDGERFTFDSAAFSDYADGFTNMPDEADFDSHAEYRKAAHDAEREGYISAMSSVLSDMKGAMPEQGAIIDEAARMLDDASSQNPEVKSLYVRIANAFDADATPQTYGRVAAGAEQAIREGKNDGAIIRLEDGTLRYFVKDSSQIKSADPVTYDDAGNVIPLSQRFNRENADIRFDTPELSVPEMNRIAKKYGTTDEYVRGWILPDGRNVDLNPTAEGAWQDHDEIRGLLDKRRGVGGSSGTLDANGREEAMRAGAIRYHNLGDEAIIDVWRKPSARQISALYDYVEKGEFDPGAKVTLSFSPGEFVTYDSVDEMRKRLVNDIRRHYSEVNFDTKNISQAPELTPAEAEYAASDDKTPTEKVMREVYGMTNDEIATALRAAGMEPPPHVRKPDEVKWQQAEALLSNPTYMAKLSRAVAKFPRPLRDYEIDALNVLFRERQNAVNAAQGEVDDWKQTLDFIADGEVGAEEKKEDARKNLAAAQSGLARAKALMLETGKAKIGGASEQGRGLRANRGSLYQDDLTYAGITGEIARIVGGAERVTPEMDAKIRDLAKLFEDLDEQGLRIATERLKPLAEKVIEQTKDGLKVRKATERKAGDEAKRVTRNYEDALNQIEVGAAEVGGTLIGLSDQQYPSWGRWLKAIGEFHCFQNPDITEEGVINAILEDISPFMDGVDANQVRDALTGFGHNFKQSRYDSQRLMNDLKSQARLKRQLDWMDENNTMPPLTGMVRDEPSNVTRNLQKQVAERKKEVPDAGRDERRLKGVLDSAKTRVRNRIADLQRAIETGERIPASQRKVVEDLELRELKRHKEELQKAYDELFKTERTMTDAQRIALTEKLLAKELERALEDLDRARAGDFSKRPKRPGVGSPTIDVLRDRIAQTREQIRELKKAKYEFGMTPEEIAALNARKMANREKAVARLAERIATGDIRPQKKPQPPMTPDQQKRYDELGEQMKRGRQKLAELRLEAENATVPTFWRKAGNFLRFVTTAQRALRATMDFSAVLRQAARMTLAHPVKAARAFGKAWTAARSEASLQDVNDEILSDPIVREAVDKYGLHLREVDATNARDVEMFHGMERNRIKLFGKEFAITDIPFFGEFMLKSERHYLTYLNAMSAEIYTSIVNDARRFPGGATPWQKKMVADMVNIWNGSAALSKERRQALQKAWVNDIFWAPQLAISRVQSAVGYDWWHPLTAKGMKNAEGGFDAVTGAERRAAAKAGLSEHMRSTIAMLAIGALLKWMFSDDDDKYNFSQADWFEKMMMLVSPKVGNTTIDLTGGESTFDKLVHQLATKSKRTGTGRLQKFGEFNGPSTWGAIGRYLQGKLSPSVSTVTALWEGKDYVGDEYGVGKMTQEMLVPLTFEDVKDQIVQNGVGKSLVTVPLTLLGAGGSTYDRKPYENAVNRFLEAKKEYDTIGADQSLEKDERDGILDGLRATNPLMRDDVREEISAHIKRLKSWESKAKKVQKAGKSSAEIDAEIEKEKENILKMIRAARK